VFERCFGALLALARERAGLYTRRAVTSTRSLDPAFVSTDDIMAAAGIARRTVSVWVEMGFLPQPLKVSLGIRGVFNRFPAYAAERARFIAAKRAGGFTYDEVRVMLAQMDAQEVRKAKAAARPPPPPATRKGGRRR
jgi:DNA-binding transcriptional MerR regulator